MEYNSRVRFFTLLLLAFGFVWAALAIDPLYREDWLFENILVVVLVPILAVFYYKEPLSRISSVCLFVFLCLHSIGAHYTYAEVPYDRWAERMVGFSLNDRLGLERNHYDRIVHFMSGLLLTYPLREALVRKAEFRKIGAYILPLLIMMSISMTYELVEWAVAMRVGGDLGMAYLGTQGDVWDAHQDMALATFGALCTLTSIKLFQSAVSILNRKSADHFVTEDLGKPLS